MHPVQLGTARHVTAGGGLDRCALGLVTGHDRPAGPSEPSGAPEDRHRGLRAQRQDGEHHRAERGPRPLRFYLNQIHNRIHPIFAYEFLATLNQAPGPWPQDLRTVVEMVIEQKTGKVVKAGVIRSSGVAPFDLAALQTVQRAQPFGPAPAVIASPDGNVYIHWEFHRDPFDACTTRNARPYILKSVP